jgi:hypothetical protein
MAIKNLWWRFKKISRFCPKFYLIYFMMICMPLTSQAYLGPGERRQALLQEMQSQSNSDSNAPWQIKLEIGRAAGIEAQDHVILYDAQGQWLGRAFCLESQQAGSLWQVYRSGAVGDWKLLENLEIKGIPLSDHPLLLNTQ